MTTQTVNLITKVHTTSDLPSTSASPTWLPGSQLLSVPPASGGEVTRSNEKGTATTTQQCFPGPVGGIVTRSTLLLVLVTILLYACESYYYQK